MATPAMPKAVSTLQGLLADQRSKKRLTPNLAEPRRPFPGMFRFDLTDTAASSS